MAAIKVVEVGLFGKLSIRKSGDCPTIAAAISTMSGLRKISPPVRWTQEKPRFFRKNARISSSESSPRAFLRQMPQVRQR